MDPLLKPLDELFEELLTLQQLLEFGPKAQPADAQ
jgi:hypothetical protein